MTQRVKGTDGEGRAGKKGNTGKPEERVIDSSTGRKNPFRSAQVEMASREGMGGSKARLGKKGFTYFWSNGGGGEAKDVMETASS